MSIPKNKYLYRVVLQGMCSTVIGKCWGDVYVVASSPNEAYKKLRDILDERDIGFKKDRELYEIKLLAEDYERGDLDRLLIT